MSRWDVPPGTSLEVLLAEWRGAMVTSVDGGTIANTYKPHSGHIAAFFRDKPMAITKSGAIDYGRHRLGKVVKTTVQKELSTLRGFLAWCVERELLDVAPDVPELPKRATGTRAAPERVNTLLTPEEARGTIAYLPEWATSKRTGESFPVKARFELAFESALRPSTISRLVAGKHYQKGWSEIRLSPDTLKRRRVKVMPINAAARAAIDRVYPHDGGLIFGRHDYRDAFGHAVRKAVEHGVLPAEKGRTLTPYDLRHSRATEAARCTTDLAALQGLLDHTDLKSTMRYVHTTEEAVRGLLDKVSSKPTRKRGGLVGLQMTSDSLAVRRPGVEPGRVINPPEPESGEASSLTDRARELLEQASANTPVAYYVLTDFARAVLSRTELGRAALGVIDGGAHGHVRALELARLVLDRSADADEAEEG